MADEQRSYHGELRAGEGVGIIEGYAAVWGTVDDYNSTFQRGAFTKTLQERGSRVKILWNHGQEVIGKPLDIHEDDRGLFVRAQLVLGSERAREVYELIKAGAVDTFSFGFRTIKDKWVNGVRAITEVALMEVSPVIFEANSAAVITGVRQMPKEERAQKYADTYARHELTRRGGMILDSLYITLQDIWYGGTTDKDAVRSQVADALSEFQAMYTQYAEDLLLSEQRDSAIGTDLGNSFRSFLAESNQTPEQFAAATSFTLEEVRSLLTGQAEVDAGKLKELPEAVVRAIQITRAAKVDALCNELRQGLADAELDRVRGLLPDPQPAAVDGVVRYMQDFRNQLKG